MNIIKVRITVSLIFEKIFGKLLKGHERSIQAKKNIALSFLFKGLSITINIILVPITISYINSNRYGVWLILSSIISWMNLFDVGLGNGLRNKLSQTHAFKQYSRSKVYISSTYAVLLIVSIGIYLLFFLVNQFVNWYAILNVSQASIYNLNEVILLFVGFFCLQFILQVINVVLTAVHATSKVSLISVISQITALIAIYILTLFTKDSLILLVVALSGIPLLVQLIATFWYFSKQYKHLAPSFQLISFSQAKGLLSVGGYFFLLQIGSLVLFETDNIVITQLFGPNEVTSFNIAYKLFSVLVNVFTIVITPFWSAFTDAYTLNDFQWIEKIFKKMYLYWIFTIAVAVILVMISPLLYRLWLGNLAINIPILLSIAMVLYVAGFCWLMIHCYLLNGIGKIRLQLMLYIISTLINIPLAIYLGKIWGTAGVTLSNVFVFLYMDILLFIQCKKILNRNATGIWNM
ncbi:MAG: LPS biosynthesis flippase [Sphingobacteriaceae bacterium]|nr:MAG: LPS biosynthesis flippase [Sphingobacteriaceae bacterium]